MEKILDKIIVPAHPDILVGIDTRDDAAVYKISDELALIQTVDFFTPMVDDPFLFGQIAAVNALNDVYAMGGSPILALNIVCYPACGDMDLLGSILQGGASKVSEAGASLLGGHTIDDNEPKYGLAVTGLINPAHILTNAGAQPGDLLYLTKPIGNGIIATAIKAAITSSEAYDEAVRWMTQLNRDASQVAVQVGVHAMTDITGFGLLGHLYEMASASHIQVSVHIKGLRVICDALEYARMGLVPGGAYTNRDYLVDKVLLDAGIETAWADLLFTPETAGGLLMAVPETKTRVLEQALQEKGICFFKVGCCGDRGLGSIHVLP